jgi:serine/threonine protein phosphatase PrpC
VVLTGQHRVYGFGPGVLEEIERVEAAGGWIHDGRVCNILAVSRAFGDPEFKVGLRAAVVLLLAGWLHTHGQVMQLHASSCTASHAHTHAHTQTHTHTHQGEGLALLLAEGAEKGSWPKDFAKSHAFASDPVIPLPDVSMVELDAAKDEFLVVATDGLWDCMPPAEAIRFARSQFKQGKGAQGVAEALVDIALKRYTTDNVAVIVADMKGGREAWTARPKGGRKPGLLSGLFGSGNGSK